ncbi:hypothetical protein VC83_04250 [Pseudogymnoascus destructans]|uniref:Uncharacterized protein n=1 Tax=Pseudogymnoascus destructans TaxID=655981 RepID=A0A177AB91_9PEZI|nr:uncharacterized protein VC83_04250 [Pseudogymnoascus destructans]OAF59377.1 hypothetical protein VC83_04250 [Pseudogymnoascus destructans]
MREQTFKESTIQSAFRKAGIWPISCNTALEKLRASVATWVAGSTQKFTVVGSITHKGGSCRASLSTDGGITFTVIQSYIGNCLLVSEFPFTVPSDTPTGPAVFSWTWFNKVGNREMYMNCASVTISSGSGSGPVDTAFSSRPDAFVTNVGKGCSTLESIDLEFPDPGPDITVNSIGTTHPIGSCSHAVTKAGISSIKSISIGTQTLSLSGKCSG